MTKTAVRRIALVGAAFSGNKGAVMMLETFVQRVQEFVGPCELTVLSPLPTADRRERPSEAVAIAAYAPTDVVASFVLASLYRVLRAASLPASALLRTAALRAQSNADVVVDLSGISFSDTRGLGRHLYHTLLAATPLLLGKKVVKLSQALGPFKNPINRIGARLTLPYLTLICARGEMTEQALRAFGLTNTCRTADLAFSHRPSHAATRDADRALGVRSRRWVGIVPSSVIAALCAKNGVDYIALLADLIGRIRDEYGLDVVLFAHSTGGTPRRRFLDDRPVCRAVFARLASRDHVDLLDRELSASALRHLIAHAEILVTSRFHAMVSALASGTLPVVVGWGHKYTEMLREFDLESCAIDYHGLTGQKLFTHLDRIIKDGDALRASILARLPVVQESSAKNFELLSSILTGAAR